MDIDLAVLPDDVGTLQRMVRTLAAERANLTEAQAEIERLRLIVQKLQRSQFGRRAEQLDNDQLQLGFEDLNADIARVEATLPPAAAKAPRVRLDRPSLPAHLPREDLRLDLDHQACPCCGGELHVIGETVSEMLDHVPARLRVIRICTVRTIFKRYLELQSFSKLVAELDRRGIVTNRRETRVSKYNGAIPFAYGPLAYFLKNRIYLGKIGHDGKWFEGEHEAIIDQSERLRGCCGDI
jgi:hypothetical protein